MAKSFGVQGFFTRFAHVHASRVLKIVVLQTRNMFASQKN